VIEFMEFYWSLEAGFFVKILLISQNHDVFYVIAEIHGVLSDSIGGILCQFSSDL
jgi:hypothetical protein